MKRVLTATMCIAVGTALAFLGPHFGAVGAYSDTTPPETTITKGPDGSTRQREPTFEFTSSEEPPFFECKVDGAVFAICDTPFQTERLSRGPHNFQVRAFDSAGNTDPTPASQDFKIKKKKKHRRG